MRTSLSILVVSSMLLLLDACTCLRTVSEVDDAGAPATDAGTDAGITGGWSIRHATPYPRMGHVAVYDEANDRMIVFGGGATDTWQLPFSGPDAGVWRELKVPGLHPPAHAYGEELFGDSAVYDPAGGRMLVLLTRIPSTATPDADVQLWELSLSSAPAWRRIVPVGPSPGGEIQSGRLAIDRAGHRLFAFGGQRTTVGLWQLTLDGAPVWSRVANGPSDTGAPFYTAETSLLFDPSRGQLILFGGHGRLRKVWGYSLASGSWSLLDPGNNASGSYGARSVLDETHDQVLIAGGDENDAISIFSLASHTWSAAPLDVDRQQLLAPSAMVDTRRHRAIYFSGSQRTQWTNASWELPFDTLIPAPLTPPTLIADPSIRQRTAAWDPQRHALVVFGAAFFGDTQVTELDGPDGAGWQVLDAGPPPDVLFNSGVYDPIDQSVLAFGSTYGATVSRLSSSPGSVWEQLAIAPGPEPRTGPAIVFDGVHHQLLVQGGYDVLPDGSGIATRDDLWALSLDGAPRWQQLQPVAPGPAARYGHVAVYDSAHDRLVLFGGFDSTSKPIDELWTLALSTLTWKRETAGGTSGASPEDPLEPASALYDPKGHRMIFVSGENGYHWNPEEATHVYALELDGALTWHRFCEPGISLYAYDVPVVLAGDGLYASVNGGALRFDLDTPYCD
ncbi:MAG: kelch repeat-containing protein [Myxococcaceae bacterium]